MRKLARRISLMAGAALLAAAGGTAAGIGGTAADASVTQTTFHMVRSAASVKANCLKGADAKVTIESEGPVEVMTVSANHLPQNTDFDLFVIQVPNAPFGISWYQGDLESNSSGHAKGTFIGRFSIETFAVAPGSAPAPQVFNGPRPAAPDQILTTQFPVGAVPLPPPEPPAWKRCFRQVSGTAASRFALLASSHGLAPR